MTSSKHILLYYPPNTRSIAMETICKTVLEAGHKLTVLTLSERGALHEVLEEAGADTLSYVQPRKPSWKFFLHHVRFLIKTCKEKKIDTVWSHLQEANTIALLAQQYMRAKIITWRHHDESTFYALYGKKFNMIRNRKEIMIDRFVNRFSRNIVVLSNHVKKTMEVYEKCNPKKITVCPLIYDFSRYPAPDPMAVAEIQRILPCEMRLIMVSRMIESKQHMAVFHVFNKLKLEGFSIKMIVMDDGPLRSSLEKFIVDHGLEEDIIMPGYRTDLINYMAAADLLVHPSLTEASNNVVKEMGLMKKAVAVCEGVGDFDDYIRAGENGFLMHRDRLEESLEQAIRQAYGHPELRHEFGERLKENVFERFADSPANREHYLKLV